MKLPLICLNSDELSNFEDSIKKEWIIINGLGGYASSTVLGLNTRKYHGLLVAAFHPPGDRRVCLSKLDEEIGIGNDSFPLGANEFQNGVFPQGHCSLKEFSISPFPKYVYSMQGVEVQKTVFMPFEKNAVITIYEVLNKNSSDAGIRVFPLVNYRHIHSVTDRWRNPLEFTQRQNRQVEMCFSNPLSVLMIKALGGKFYAAGKWFEKVYYREEALRGESCLDDCYELGYFEIGVKSGDSEKFAVIAVADENEVNAQKLMAEMPASVYDVETLLEKETKRKENFLAKFYGEHVKISMSNWLDWAVLASDMFIVKGADAVQRSVIAGYHWFESWGRDTFVSLPGLMLVIGRFEDARKVFLAYKKHCKQGLIPNFVPDRVGQPFYNSVDATLWFVNAVLQYLKYTGDFRFVHENLWAMLKAIVENHVKGTLFGIHVDGDGLLSHEAQLTWMDAAVDGQPATSRSGKAVEVQALWYNALRIMELLANRFKERSEAEKYDVMAEKARKSFGEKFWNVEKNCLFDVVDESGRDGSLRPNQIFAVALDFAMLDSVKSESVVDVVHRELLTPYGLRTLAKGDSRYVGVYAGDRRSRDKAYHNGTAWPWLLGSFTTAFLKTKGYATYRREYALKNLVLPLFSEQIHKVGLGTLSEIFDGEPPHAPRGCISQAWSVAEPLRAYIEDVMQVRPKYEREVIGF